MTLINYQKKGYYVVHGISAPYYYEKSSWIWAERRARIEAAMTISLDIKAMEMHIDEQNVKTVVAESDAVLMMVQTVARGIDSKSGARWVIVRLPIP